MCPAPDPGAVLDGRLRVRGLRGLRVVDAAALPHVVSANINAAIVMVAERAADFVKEEYPPLAGPLARRRARQRAKSKGVLLGGSGSSRLLRSAATDDSRWGERNRFIRSPDT